MKPRSKLLLWLLPRSNVHPRDADETREATAECGGFAVYAVVSESGPGQCVVHHAPDESATVDIIGPACPGEVRVCLAQSMR